MTEADLAPEVPPLPMGRSCPVAPPDGYASLRAERPITPVRLPTGRITWLVTSHEYARQLLADPRLAKNRTAPGFPAIGAGAEKAAQQIRGFLASMDPPEHAVNRRLVMADFTVRRVQAMRPQIERIVQECLRNLLETERPADLVAELALPVPSLVICELLGVPYESREVFQQRTATALSLGSTPEQSAGALREVRALLADLVSAKQAAPDQDLLSRLIIRYQQAGLYDHEHLTGLATQLLIGGHETTANMISLGVLSLLTDPLQRAQLAADPDLMPSAVEELLRFYSIADYVTGRVALQQVDIGGIRIAAGEGVFIPIAAANHDPQIFPDPTQLNLQRDTRSHLAFGYGAHQCPGQGLARLELQIVFSALLSQVPTLALAAPVDDLLFKHDATIYGLYRLPVTW